MSSDSGTNESLSFADSEDRSESCSEDRRVIERAKYDHTAKNHSRTLLRLKVVIQMIMKKKETSMWKRDMKELCLCTLGM